MYEKNWSPIKLDTKLASVNTLFGAAKLNKNSGFDEYSHLGYSIEHDRCWYFSLSFNSGLDKNAIMIVVDNSFLIYSDTLGKGLIEAQCSLKFTKP